MNIESWMVDTIYVASSSGSLDGYGKPSYATARAVSCRVEGNSRVIPGEQNEQQANHRIATLDEIKSDDKIWLPGDSTSDASLSKRPILITTATVKDGSQRLWEVFL